MGSCILNIESEAYMKRQQGSQPATMLLSGGSKACTSFSVSCRVSICLTLNSYQTCHVSVAITWRLAFNPRCTHSACATRIASNISNISIPFYQNLGEGIAGVHGDWYQAGHKKSCRSVCFYFFFFIVGSQI